MILRISASLLLLFSIIFLPFYISILLVLAGMIYFSIYWEGVVLFLLSDLLYGVKETKSFPIIFTSFLIGVVALIIIEMIKKKLKFYPSK